MHRTGSATASVVQQQHAQQQGPDITALDQNLQAQWHHTANVHLGNAVIKESSQEQAWWTCDQCPDGHLHHWLASITERSQGSGCPYCYGEKACSHNCLATVSPKAASYWDTARNGCFPDLVVAHSRETALWQCHTCGYEWSAKIDTRVQQSRGCPRCLS